MLHLFFLVEPAGSQMITGDRLENRFFTPSKLSMTNGQRGWKRHRGWMQQAGRFARPFYTIHRRPY